VLAAKFMHPSQLNPSYRNFDASRGVCAAEQNLLMTHGKKGAIVRTYDGVALGEDGRLYQEQANF
jgi:hypothetical protein